MNPEVKAKWVQALRSGEYKQGTTCLRSPNDTFCCLGVLCDLHAKLHGKTWSRKSVDGPYRYDNHPYTLPDSVVKWAGMDREDGGVVLVNDRSAHLTGLNDTGSPFDFIADLIEAQL